jgi:hypothetical protein
MNTRPESRPGAVILVRLPSLHPLARYGNWIALMLMLMIPVVTAAVLWHVLDDSQARERLWRALLDSIWRQPDNLLAMAAMPFVLLYLAVEQPARLKDRIVIGETGIEFQRPARWRLPFTPRAWSLPWARLRKAELKPLGPSLVLTLSDGTHTRRIVMNEWVAPDTPRETVKLLLKQRLQQRHKRVAPEEALRLAEESPLLRALRTRGVAIQHPDASSPLVFDLLKNRHAAAAVALLAVIGLYGVADIILLDETYAGSFPWALWTMAGAIIAVLTYRWLSAAKLPFAIAIVLALMIGLDAGFAMYPGLLRLNQFTDAAGMQAHEYVLREYVRLEPLEAGLPVIEFDQGIEYWQQFRPGASYTFYLRHGGLGFYQLDIASVYAETRAFYEKRDIHSPTRGQGKRESLSPST